MALEERESIRNLDNFLCNTLFPSRKKITPAVDGANKDNKGGNSNSDKNDINNEKITNVINFTFT